MTLAWFEKHPTLDAYRVGSHYIPYALLAREVRFSDAELAAETWMARGDVSYWWTQQREAEARVLERFATYPHFDES